MAEIKLLEAPIKSEGDKKDYRLIQLPNGLKALLIHFNEEFNTESEDIAAAMLTVKVGSFDDPKNAMGLAHFLEHIVSMGSEKYPGENSFNEFLTSNGGRDNAMTASEFTGYYFSIAEKVFPKALDIFANQFISPLLSKNAMQREREAVDSEYQMATSNDSILIENIYKSFINENHPASQFDCGNLKTLKDDITDDDLHLELLKFFEKYVGSKMFLSVQSKQSLDEIQNLVVNCFGDIKSGSSHSDVPIMTLEEIFKPEFYSNMIYMNPKSATKSLRLTWTLPSLHDVYKCSPIDYINLIIGNEGSGGLKSYLQEKELITSLSFFVHSNSFGGNSLFSMPRLSITLTDHGSENIEKILEAVFSYLLMIKETPIEEHRRLYNEYKERLDLEFKFHSESSALSNVKEASSNMLIYDDIDILRASSIFDQFDESIISKTIDQLNQRKFNLMILNSDHETFPKKEKYFGAEYDEVTFPEEYQKLWDDRNLNSEFFLERPNPYQASNFEIYKNEAESPKFPVKIMEDDILEVWHKLDNHFQQPKASIAIQLLSPKHVSIQNYLFLSIYDYMLTQHLSKTYSQQAKAGLDVNISMAKRYFQVKFNGYNDKMTAFIDEASKEIKNFSNDMQQSMFESIKSQHKKRYLNALLRTNNLNDEYVNEIIRYEYYHDFELYNEIDSITFENLQKFMSKFFNAMKIKILVQGNMTKDQALNVANILKINFACEALDSEYELKGRCFKLPLGTNVFRVKSLRMNDDNSEIRNYYQIGPENLRNRNLAKLLESILHPKAFDYLRNKLQLGYSVGCALHDSEGVIGLRVQVSSQEHKHAYTEVFEKMDIFINEIAKTAIEELTDDEFENFKQARIKGLMADEKTLSDEVQLNWSEIKENEYIFNRYELAAKLIKPLTKTDLKEFFDGFTKPENMRRLSVQVIGNDISADSQEIDPNKQLKLEILQEKLSDEEKHVGEDVKEFQKNLELYPLVKFAIE